MTSSQNAREYVKDKLQRGLLSAAEANVLLVQIEGVRVIRGKVPMEVRKALNAAVKAGELGHIKKEGMKPEVYHHKNARPKAISIRNEEMRKGIESLSNVCGGIAIK